MACIASTRWALVHQPGTSQRASAGLPGGRPVVKDQVSEPRRGTTPSHVGAREAPLRATLRLTGAGRCLIRPRDVGVRRSPSGVEVGLVLVVVVKTAVTWCLGRPFLVEVAELFLLSRRRWSSAHRSSGRCVLWPPSL